jgi:DNA-binding MarR family transcriptional regulator
LFFNAALEFKLMKSEQKRGKSMSSDDDAPTYVHRITREWRQARPDLPLSDFLLALYLMQLGVLIDRAYSAMSLRLFGLRGADMRVLLTLRRIGLPYALRPTDLFRSLLVTPGAMTKQIDRLEVDKLIERQRDPSHRGGSLIVLTKRGVDMVDEAVNLLAKESPIGPATRAMSQRELKTGTQFCCRLVELLGQLGVHEPGSQLPRPSTGKYRRALLAKRDHLDG